MTFGKTGPTRFIGFGADAGTAVAPITPNEPVRAAIAVSLLNQVAASGPGLVPRNQSQLQHLRSDRSPVRLYVRI
ncbi:MAG: hypothetical protein GY803_17850 [Chloroflexi bacterium]|nr:hypothetical protein [Chloroflexota bacterium]